VTRTAFRSRVLPVVEALSPKMGEVRVGCTRDIRIWRHNTLWWTQQDGGGCQYSRTASAATDKAWRLTR